MHFFENVLIPIKTSLKVVPKGPINNIPAMVQIVAWRRPGDKPLSEPMIVSLLTHTCVARLQWVGKNTSVITALGSMFRDNTKGMKHGRMNATSTAPFRAMAAATISSCVKMKPLSVCHTIYFLIKSSQNELNFLYEVRHTEIPSGNKPIGHHWSD